MAAEIWGDGFADDDVFAASTLRRWSDLGDGEAARFFPALRCRDGAPAPECVARIRRSSERLEAAGQHADARWLLSMLATPGAPGPVSTARFAFLTGLHPAYLWAAEACAPAFGATAAWLGELSRRGRAYMPPDVAEYLLDVLTPARGVRDEGLAGLGLPASLWPGLRRAAQARLHGRVAVVRWKAGASLRDAMGLRLARWRISAPSWLRPGAGVRRSA